MALENEYLMPFRCDIRSASKREGRGRTCQCVLHRTEVPFVYGTLLKKSDQALDFEGMVSNRSAGHFDD